MAVLVNVRRQRVQRKTLAPSLFLDWFIKQNRPLIMANLNNRLAVLVVSCDQYSDLWKPFFSLFWLFWPDCPFLVYLLSNSSTFTDPRIRPLMVGKDVSWSDNLVRAISQLPHDYVLLFLDDLFLVDNVDTGEVIRILDWAVASQVNYVRFSEVTKPDRPYSDLVGFVSPGRIYRASTVMSVWKKEILLALLRPGESAWDFETKGSVRSEEFNSFFSVWHEPFHIINSVIKGKWRPCAVKKLHSLGVEVDLSKRTVMTPAEAVGFFLKEQRSKALRILPVSYRRSIRTFFEGATP